MRVNATGFLFLIAGVATPCLAHADSYGWGGTVGRFSVGVQQLGFHDGAGRDGWEPEGARQFATWGAYVASVVPPDRNVAAVMGLDDTALCLEIHDNTGTLLDRIETSIHALELVSEEYREITRVLLRYFGRTSSLPPPRPRPIFTVQLAATRNGPAAEALANQLRERGAQARGSFYHESCGPCFESGPKVLAGTNGHRAVYRIVSGIFDSRRTATRAQRRLEAETGHRGFVRRL